MPKAWSPGRGGAGLPSFLFLLGLPRSGSSCCALPTRLGTGHPGTETLANLTLWGPCTADSGRWGGQEGGLILHAEILTRAAWSGIHRLQQQPDLCDIRVAPRLRKPPFTTHSACYPTTIHTNKAGAQYVKAWPYQSSKYLDTS